MYSINISFCFMNESTFTFNVRIRKDKYVNIWEFHSQFADICMSRYLQSQLPLNWISCEVKQTCGRQMVSFYFEMKPYSIILLIMIVSSSSPQPFMRSYWDLKRYILFLIIRMQLYSFFSVNKPTMLQYTTTYID